MNLCVFSIGDTRLCIHRTVMDHRALESSVLARKVLPVSPASLLLVAEQVLA